MTRFTVLHPGDEPDDDKMGRLVGALNALFEARNHAAPPDHLSDLITAVEIEWRALLKDTEEEL